MIKINSYYDKDTMTDIITITDGAGYISFKCPHSMTMQDYCSAIEGAINKLNG